MRMVFTHFDDNGISELKFEKVPPRHVKEILQFYKNAEQKNSVNVVDTPTAHSSARAPTTRQIVSAPKTPRSIATIKNPQQKPTLPMNRQLTALQKTTLQSSTNGLRASKQSAASMKRSSQNVSTPSILKKTKPNKKVVETNKENALPEDNEDLPYLNMEQENFNTPESDSELIDCTEMSDQDIEEGENNEEDLYEEEYEGYVAFMEKLIEEIRNKRSIWDSGIPVIQRNKDSKADWQIIWTVITGTITYVFFILFYRTTFIFSNAVKKLP